VRQLAALLGSSHSAQQAGSTPASTLLLAREGMEPWLPAFACSPRKLVQTTGTVALDENIENEAVLVDGTPEPMLLPGEADDHLIEVPFVATARRSRIGAACCGGRRLPIPTPCG
jgi:hypothetical protein